MINITPREKQVLSHLLTGKKNKEISNELGVSTSTVNCMVSLIGKKLRMNTREIILNREKILGVLA